MRWSRLFLIILAFVICSGVSFAISTFTEEFDTFNYISYMNLYWTNGYIDIGFAEPHVGYIWYNEWGDIEVFGGNVYVVWADRRYNGIPQIFLQKLSTSDLSYQSSTNIIISINPSNASFENSYVRPGIKVYDLSTIYIYYGALESGFCKAYLTRFSESGGNFNFQWLKRVDNGFGDNVSYTPIPFKLFGAIGANGELFLGQIWRRVGSGDTAWISKVMPTGDQYWLNTGYPGTMYLTTFNGGSFIIAGEALYLNGFLYVSGQHWIWSPSRDFGVGVNKISTNNTYSASWGGGTNVSDRGIIYDYTVGNSPRVSLAFDNSDGSLVVVFSDKRNGSMDVFITKVNTNTGAFIWSAPSVRVVANGNGDQENPSVMFDNLGNILVLYVDYSPGYPSVKIAKVSRDNGEVLGIMTCDNAKYYSSSTVYHPKFRVLSDGSIILAFAEFISDKRVVKIAKYDSFGGNLLYSKSVMQENYQELYYKKVAYMISSRLAMVPPVGTPINALVNSVYETYDQGNVQFELSVDGGVNWYSVNTNTLFTFPNIGSDLRIRINLSGSGLTNIKVDSYTLTVQDFYTGDLYLKTNTNDTYEVGVNYISSEPENQVITNYGLSDGVNKIYFYVHLTNSGNTNKEVYLYGSGGNSVWGLGYFDELNNNISSSILDGSWNSVLSNQTRIIRVELTPSTSAQDGEVYNVYLYSTVTQGNYLHDSVNLKAIAWKYLHDTAISNSLGIIGFGLREVDPSIQKTITNVNSMFYGYTSSITNFIVISNLSFLNDVIMISNDFSVSSGSLSDWDILVYNVSDGQNVVLPYYMSIPANSYKVIRLVVSPKTNVPVGSVLTTKFFTRSTNGIAFYDPLRFDSAEFSFVNFKVQPDLILATNSFFVGGVEDDNYVSTNTSLTQSIMVRTVNNVSLTFYIRIQNDGLQTDTFFLKANKITNSGWTEEYYIDSDNVTYITNGTNLTLNPGQYISIRAIYTPDGTVASGNEPWVKIESHSTNVPDSYDIVYARPRNIKVYPDLLIGKDLSSLVGDNIYNNTGNNQWITNRIQKLNTVTNYIVLQNDSPTDPDNIILVGDYPASNWFVRYLDYSDNDITTFVTNSTNISMPLNSSITLKVVITPQGIARDDEVYVLAIRSYSWFVSSQEDLVIITNKAISIKPDMGVFGSSGWVDLPIMVGDYFLQSSSNKVIAGNTNYYKVRVKNDTGSVEDYVFKASLQNVGGGINDWNVGIFRVVGSMTNDMTSQVISSSGWTNTFVSNETIEFLVRVILTNAVDDDFETTYGAVSNQLRVLYDFYSVSDVSKLDRASHVLEVVRGMPDVYHEMGLVGLNIITNELVSQNRVTYGVTLNYLRETYFRFKNVGDYRDVFKVSVSISNDVGEVSNWIYKFYLIEGSVSNEITSSITNSGIFVTNLTNGYEKIISMNVVNSNGFVNDRVFFIVSFETVTKEVRKDIIWYDVVITPGLPDVLVYDKLTSTTNGEGQFATISSVLTKVETSERGRYRVLLRNIAPVEGYPPFKLELFKYGEVSKFDVYHTNKSGNFVDMSLPYSNNISNYSAVNDWPQDWIDVEVIPNGASPGDKIILKYRLSLYDNDSVYDEFYVTNIFVNPGVKLFEFSSSTNYLNVYIGKYQGVDGVIVISNTDVVWEEFLVSASQNNSSGFQVKFKTNSTDVSSQVFSGNWNIGKVEGHQITILGFSITNISELLSGTTNVIKVWAKSKKNQNRTNIVVMNAIIVDAVADVFATGNEEGTTVGLGQGNTFSTNKIEINETNVHTVYLSNAISSGGEVRFRISLLSNNVTSEFVTKFYDFDNNDITSLVSTSNYIVNLASGQYTTIKVVRIMTNTNNVVKSGFGGIITIGMETADVNNNIADVVTLVDLVSDPKFEVRSAGAFDPIWNFDAYSSSGKIVKTFKNIPATVYLGVKNIDSVWDKFVVKANGSAGKWVVRFFNLANEDITTNVVNGSYVTESVNSGEFAIVKATITPDVDVSPSDEFTLVFEVKSYENNSVVRYITNRVLMDSGIIVGKVLDKKTKEPIKGAKLKAIDPYGVESFTTSDDNGEYRLPVYPLPNAQYTLYAEADGYVGNYTNFYLSPTTNIIDIYLVTLGMTADKTDVRIFPNPMKSGERVSLVYAVDEEGVVDVGIYDINGRELKTLVKGEKKSKGVYYVLWDGSDNNGFYLKRGVYIFFIKVNGNVVVKKLLVK